MGLEGLFASFLTGLMSSLGHCIGMCGSLVAAHALSGQRDPSRRVRVLGQPTLLLHTGRLTTYAMLGVAMGSVGALLDLMGSATGWQGLLSIVAGLAMLFISLRLSGVLPAGEIAPTFLFRSLRVGSRLAELRRGRGAWSSLGAGLLWGLLPCGLVFAMLVNAAATGNGVSGALVMVAFGLGTVPALVGFGLVATRLGVQFRQRLLRFAAVPVLFLAVQSILRGLAAAGVLSSVVIGGVMLW